MEIKIKPVLNISIILILRFVIGAVFVFSGFAKSIDIWGDIYKISDYLNAFGWTYLSNFTGILSVALPIAEFLLGFWLIIGTFRRITVALLLLMMAFMLPLTAYIAIYNPVSDCGCFGDAITISNTATFWKNVALTIGLAYLFVKNKSVRSVYGPAVQWLTVLFPSIYILIIISAGYYQQPLIDFRPFKIGTYISGSDNDYSDEEFAFIYEKGGKRQTFSIDALPDSSWNFVERKEITKKTESSQAHTVNKVAIFDHDEDVTNQVLPKEGDVILLLLSDISDIDVASTFKINDMHEFASESGMPMICLTGGSEKGIQDWQEISMASYPIYTMDDSELKTIARGNPAVVKIADGKILWKSTLWSVDNEDLQTGDEKAEVTSFDDFNLLSGLTLILIIFMAVLFLINRTHLLIKFTLRMRKNQNKAVNLPKK